MWREELKKVAEIERSFGEELRGGKTPEAAKSFASEIEKAYGIALPDAYIEFLTCTDGYDFNGYCVYGASADEGDYLSMLGQNRIFHRNSNLKKYWFYGTSDTAWYVLDRETGLYLEMDASETVYESFPAFDGLLTKIISDSLGD